MLFVCMTPAIRWLKCSANKCNIKQKLTHLEDVLWKLIFCPNEAL